MPNNLVIFDLDGTLADTAPDLIATLNRVTQPYGVKPVALKNVGQIVGQGAKAMIARAFSLDNKPLEPTLHELLFKEFLDRLYDFDISFFHVFVGIRH